MFALSKRLNKAYENSKLLVDIKKENLVTDFEGTQDDVKMSDCKVGDSFVSVALDVLNLTCSQTEVDLLPAVFEYLSASKL
mmetsp:Transcript_32161/g.70066  ORF Transcript_32161/g.70066 Transcript_32161/m.70066 type:complete len:81 (-) Transcript_32161:552-794(-)